jgi:hypothetical protein
VLGRFLAGNIIELSMGDLPASHVWLLEGNRADVPISKVLYNKKHYVHGRHMELVNGRKKSQQT